MIVYRYADLHLHTYYSDGSFSPEELFDLARQKHFSVISITDHDTVQGVIASKPLVPQYGVELIPGIELSCLKGETEIHILGYFIDPFNRRLVSTLEEIRAARLDRARRMIEALNRLGFPGLTLERVLTTARHGVVGRLHIARAMVDDGLARNIGEVFMRYLGNGGPAFFPKYKLTPEEGIGLIREAGGLAVLAHPLSGQNLLDMLPELVTAGIEGLEVFYSDLSESDTEKCYDAATRNNLLITGGSDCHGSHKKEVLLGKVKLPIDYVDRLKSHHAYRRDGLA